MTDPRNRTMRIDMRGHSPRSGPLERRARMVSDSVHVDGESGYERLLESVYDGVLITDRDGVIRDHNRRAVEFLAQSSRELEGARVVDFVSGASPELLSALQENLDRHRFTLIEAYCARTDGTMFPAEIAVNRVALGGGRELSFFIRDVTVRRQAEDARERAMADLEALNEARSEFVGNVSHELRTPLTSMIYAVANLLRGVAGPLSGKVREYLEMLNGNCQRLLGTVNDILDLRKLESNSLVLTKTKVPFVLLVQKAVRALDVQARQKSLAMAVAYGPRRYFVECDVPKMERVVLNIVGNAVKFTPDQGNVHVQVEGLEKEGRVRLTVRDSGIGIPAEDIGKVMKRYYTVGEQPYGSGLGLSIAKEIVDLHGGTIEIASPCPGETQGTQICVELPTVESASVFLGSNCEDGRRRLTSQLRRQGYIVTPFESVTLMPEHLSRELPGLIVVDLTFEEAATRDLLLELRSSKRTLRVPIVALVPDSVAGETAAILKSLSIPTLPTTCGDEQIVESVAGTLFLRAAPAAPATLKLDASATGVFADSGNA